MRYPQPPNEDEFEEFCLILLKRHWSCLTLERFAHRGEGQDGVDIIDLSGADPLRGAQCKHHAPDKTLPSSELREEVEKAKKFNPPLKHYLVLTSAKKSGETQRELIAINREHAKQGLFTVALMTWEAIERLIDDYAEVRERLEKISAPAWKEQTQELKREIATVKTEVVRAIEEAIPRVGANAFDTEIDEAREHLRRNENQLAQLLLNRLRARHWDQLTSRQRYRVEVNRAGALMGVGEFVEAGRLLVTGASYQPDEVEAQAFEASGYELIGEQATAYEKAGQVLANAPATAKAAAVRVRCAPSTQTFDELQREISASAVNAEVAIALAVRALNEGLFDRVRELAMRATEESPDWPPGWLVLGQAYFGAEAAKFHAARIAPVPFDRANVEEAERCITRAIEISQAQQPAHPTLLDALLVRAHVRDLLGDGGGDSDLEQAYRIEPDQPRVLIDFAMLLSERGKLDEAIACQRRAVSLADDSHAKFMLAVSLWNKGDAAARKEATAFFGVAARDDKAPFQHDAAIYALRGYWDQAAWSDAENFIVEVTPTLDPITVTVLTGTLAHAQNRARDAKQAATQAYGAITAETRAAVVRCVAHLLSMIGLHAEALPLWQRLLVPGYYTPDAYNLIACAERIGRYDIALDTCRSLRESGAGTRELSDQEVGLLERSDPRQAIALLRERLVAEPTDKVARLWLSLLGLRIGQKDLIATELRDLPSVEEIRPAWIPKMVRVLEEAQPPGDVLTYAYRALRRYYQDVEAHEAYFYLLTPSNTELPIIQPATVAPGTAVSFVDDRSADLKWLVIEDDVDCYPLLNEHRPDDHLSAAFMGKVVGDTVILAKSDVQDRTATIKEIVSKYVYRYQDVINNWELRFPNHPIVQMYRLQPKPDDPSNFDITPILKVIDQRYWHGEKVLTFYRENFVPIHFAATALNQSDLLTAIALATDQESAIRVGERTPQEIADLFASLQGGAVLVADTSAIATIFLLDLEEVLERIAPKVLLSFSVNDDCTRAVADRTNRAMTGTMSRVPGGHAFHEITDPERAARSKLATQVEELRRHVQLDGCPTLPTVPPERRTELEEIFGAASVEAIVNSSVPGRALWTDDFTVAFGARQHFGAKSISTELLLRYWAERGFIEQPEYLTACAKLIAWRYEPTPVNAEIVVAAARRSEWNPDGFPLSNVLDLMGHDGFTSRGVVSITCYALAKLFLEIDFPEKRSHVLTAMLNRIGKRRDWRLVVQLIARGLRLTFGLNVVRLSEAEEIIRAWLAHRRSLIIG